jgi:nucleoside-specific outer membrane channel protein Tsx
MQSLVAVPVNKQQVKTNMASVLTGVALLSFAMTSVMAADWQATNVQLLHGTAYEDLGGAIDDKEKTVFTLENANGWAYGDNFFFVDVSNPTAMGTAYYAEFSPRFSIGKIAGSDLSAGLVKDVMLAMTWEMGQGLHAILYGIGLPLDLPGFAFADVNIYARDSTHDAFGKSQSGYQVTLDWLYPFSVGSAKFAFEGFFDYAFGEDGGANPKKDNIITAPRLLVDIGGGLQLGVEYQIWRNKFGIDGVDEDVTQVMLKWNM